ncbi:MAG: glycerophosphodiester phosphodiesterase family protein [Deltaproteobacteria bacterium]|nr:glycerophosphodiester phosphodiesterase family protein [Deltaproteobacteria bacterium]
MSRAFIKIGHRGASAYEPENTLPAFSKAIELGADMIELDVHLCRSGELVVIHDENVERTTNGSGLVPDMILEALKKLDAGKGESIPLLSEVIDLIDKRCALNIELKGKGTALPAVRIVSAAIKEKGWLKDDFLFSSFSREELIASREAFSDIKLGLNIAEVADEFSSFANDLSLFSIHPDAHIVTKELVGRIHKLGMKVFVWTVDDPRQIAWMKKLGVEGIFSNYPDRL